MFDGSRLRRLMSDREISQSELARRVGISQASIYRLVSGEAYGTKHLHKIARVLGTTPAFLAGETEDPNEGAPPPPALSCEEVEWVELFRRMDDGQRAAALTLLRPLVDPAQTPHPTLQKQGSFAMRTDTI